MPEQDQPIRVLLVEDHEHVLWGLKKLVDGEWPRMTVVGTAKTVPQGLAALHKARTDVVVLDLFFGEENSLDQLPQFAASGAVIVVLTGSRDTWLHRRALQAGARTVVLKEEPAEVLLREIARANEWRLAPRHGRARQQDCQSAVGTGSAGIVCPTTRR
jgi:two-component system, NarL family, nitrate/nitrite response regulator NarL